MDELKRAPFMFMGFSDSKSQSALDSFDSEESLSRVESL
jgi:hypothetical protein